MLKKILNNKQTPFWFIAFSTVIGLTLFKLIQDGMFMDAMLYTSVSHNLSMGIGTFWFPQFSVLNVSELPAFHEQPPLVFGIQAIFFKVFGDSMYVERFYTFLTMCITAILINKLWKDIFRNRLQSLGWIPIILWITIPVCFWSYSNNMLENTMGIFTLSAVILIYKALQKDKLQIISLILAGIFIFLATLSKGLPGFFPILIPFMYWIIFKKNKFSITILQTLIIILIPIIIYCILFLIPVSNESLNIYIFKRVLKRINQDPTVVSRFYILFRLFTELIPQLSVVIIIFIIAKIKKINLHIPEHLRTVVFFILIGLSASIPLMLTLVQKGFYFVPSLPYFAIGISILIAPILFEFINKINIKSRNYKLFLLISIFLFVATTTISIMQKGKCSRNKELLHDVYMIGNVVPKHSTVSVPRNVWNNWSLQCYFIRYYNISLVPDYKNSYCIIDNTIKEDTIPQYKKMNIPTIQYDLYKK